MAFNPFHRFRKHQKVFFAILTIVCMMVFIFSFGPGDLFTRGFSNWRTRGPEVARLYGKKIYQYADLYQTRDLRELANTYLVNVVRMGRANAVNEAAPVLQEMKDQAVQEAFLHYQLRQDPRFRNSGFFYQKLPEQIAMLTRLLESPQIKADKDREKKEKALSALLAALTLDAWDMESRRTRSEFYFGGGRSTEDILDFMIWKHQADRLGIKMDAAETAAAVRDEAGSDSVITGKSFLDDPFLHRLLSNERKFQQFTAAEAVKAIADEFRVALAQEALLGSAPGVRAFRSGGQPDQGVIRSPAAATPDEALESYRRAFTLLRVAMLPISVDHFVKEVKASPSEADLKALFRAHRDQEPTPFRDEPGFKIPRRVRVQYVSATPDLPAFQALARMEIARPSLQVFAQAAGVGAGGHLPGTLAATLALFESLGHRPLAPAGENDLRPRRWSHFGEYDAYVTGERNNPWLPQTSFFDRKPVPDAVVFRPGPLVFMTGRALGNPLLGGSLGAVPGALAGVGGTLGGDWAIYAAPEHRRVLSAFLALNLLFTPQPGGSLSVMSPLLNAVPYPTALPEPEVIQFIVINRLLQGLAPEVMNEALERMRADVAKNKSDKEKAAKVVNDFVKKFGLQDRLKTMSRAEDRYHLDKDPALQPMRVLFDKDPNNDPRRRDFAALLMGDTVSIYEPQLWTPPRSMDLDSLDKPEDKIKFLFWHIEDLRDHVPEALAEVRPQVVEAWKRLKARGLARAKAEEIQKQLQKDKNRQTPAEAVKFLKEIQMQVGGDVFPLDDVSRLARPKEVVPSLTRVFKRYEPPADKILYPPLNFVDKLMDKLREKGDSVVIWDLPEAHYYVTVLLERVVPGRSDFLDVYASAGEGKGFWTEVVMAEQRREYRERFLRQMRSDASGGKVDADGKLILSEEMTRQTESSDQND